MNEEIPKVNETSEGVTLQDRPSSTGDERRRAHKDIVDALDRLVSPLDQVLTLMQRHADDQQKILASQRRILFATAISAALILASAAHQLRLVGKISLLEAEIALVKKTGEESSGKLTDAQKKLDETKLRSAESEKKLEETASMTLIKLLEAKEAPSVHVALPPTSHPPSAVALPTSRHPNGSATALAPQKPPSSAPSDHNP